MSDTTKHYSAEDITGDPRESISTDKSVEQHAVTKLDEERFSLWSVLGVQYTLGCAPLAIAGYMQFTLGVGGSPYFFWCFIVAAVGQGIVVMTFAELSSAYPHVAGQTYWTAILAPPKYRRFLTYLNGIMTLWGWNFAVAGGYFLSTQFILGTASILNSNYVPQHYQSFLMSIAMFIIAIAMNTWLIKFYPAVTKFFVVAINVAVVYIIVAILAKAQPKADAKTVFIDVINNTGWGSDGLVFCLGMLPTLVALCLPDGATHLTEELPNPQRRVPQIMIGSFLLSFLGAFFMIIVLLFCTVNPAGLLEPLGGQPIFQICWDAWNNTGFLVTIGIIFSASFVQGCNSCLTGESRIAWSFAKSGGLPWGSWLTKVDDKTLVPVNSVLACAVVALAFDFLEFAPAYVLNAIYGSAGICFGISYGLPVVLLVLQGRDRLPANRYINLGRAGLILNILMIGWICFEVVFLSFPLNYPVTTDNMNWASVVAIGCLVLSIGNWFIVKNKYCVPEALAFEIVPHGSSHHHHHHHEDNA
ncbi:hypothetical protein AYO21_10324 [Fonsecaea monophora]|uniref:Amino acid permease/ SLC12A domain-containing protein n=1 Tax=Fonsecaea monophora TaxID=254056 RepID=A0A177EV59_9EURO|nr:hypothetical protein AYO21_10324 [Fonsecaea monophora]OAG35516.1 hypothetical protein AYO21_10324 [Fonsecaea monophora]